MNSVEREGDDKSTCNKDLCLFSFMKMNADGYICIIVPLWQYQVFIVGWYGIEFNVQTGMLK